MTRSRKQTPIRGITSAVSEKSDKIASHRRIRRAIKQVVAPDLEEPLPVEKELTNTWSMAKDGKKRFDPSKDPKLMRK